LKNGIFTEGVKTLDLVFFTGKIQYQIIKQGAFAVGKSNMGIISEIESNISATAHLIISKAFNICPIIKPFGTSYTYPSFFNFYRYARCVHRNPTSSS
jgi:hypothetical protein